MVLSITGRRNLEFPPYEGSDGLISWREYPPFPTPGTSSYFIASQGLSYYERRDCLESSHSAL